MKILKRVIAPLALVVLTIATTLSAAPAYAAPTYWKFKNTYNGKCLHAGDTNVWLETCSATDRQEWDWVGSGTYQYLRNKLTGKCLTTDDKTLNNSVWSSPCSYVDGKLWAYGGSGSYLSSHYSSWLRSSPSGSEAVYASHEYMDYGDNMNWIGTHN